MNLSRRRNGRQKLRICYIGRLVIKTSAIHRNDPRQEERVGWSGINSLIHTKPNKYVVFLNIFIPLYLPSSFHFLVSSSSTALEPLAGL